MHRPAASPARERVSDDEVRWLWSACAVVGEPFGSLIKLLLLTGARLNEAAGMTLGELDGTTWNIPGSRTKNHRPHTEAPTMWRATSPKPTPMSPLSTGTEVSAEVGT